MSTVIEDLVKKYNIEVPDDEGESNTPDETTEDDNSTSPENLSVEDFIRRINEKSGKTVIDLDNPLEGTENASVPRVGPDVTAPVQAAEQADQTRDYEYFYGEKPKPPKLTTRAGAIIGDIANSLSDNVAQSPNQKERDAYNTAMEEFKKNALEVYNNADEISVAQAKLMGIELPQWVTDPNKFEGTAEGQEIPGQYPTTAKIALGMMDDDRKVRVSYRLIKDETGALKKEAILVPNPDSTAFSRVFTQAASTIIQESLGLLERDAEGNLDLKYLENSDLANAIPDLEQGFAEGLVTDILEIGAPSAIALSAGKKVGKLIPAAQLPKTAQTVSYTGGLIASTLTEGAMSKEGDTGLVFTPELVGTLTNSDDAELNADVAMIVDGLVFNGALDGLFTAVGKGYGWFAGKSKGIKGLLDPEYVRSESAKQAILQVVTSIDPNLVGADKRTLAEGLRNLSLMLGDNAIQSIRVGQTVRDIPVDTVNAIRTGARDYLDVTHRNIKRTMSDSEWEKFLDDEAMAMLERTVTLVRGSADNTQLRRSQADLTSQFGDTITKEADRIGGNLEETSQMLVDQRTGDIAAATKGIEAQESAAAAFSKKLETIVSDDPFIAQLLQDTDAFKFFDEGPYVDQLVKLFGEDYVKVYKKTFDEVNAKYQAIPNVPIDLEALKSQLDSVFQVSGNDTPRVLKVLNETFKPKKTGAEFDIGPMDDPQAAQMKSIFQTPEEVLAGLEGEIGFQDLYRLKQNLAKVIQDTDDAAVRSSLISLRNSITSTADGGQMKFVIDQGKASDDEILQEAAGLAQAADENFILSQSKMHNSATGDQLADLAVTPTYAGANTAVPPGGSVRGQPDLETQSVTKIAPQIMADKTGSQFDQFVFAMDTMLSRDEVSKPFLDMYTAKATDDLAKALASGDTQSAATIMRTFETISNEMRRLNSPLLADLELAMKRIKDAETGLMSGQMTADSLAAQAKQAKFDAENTIVKNLVSKFGGPGVSKSTPTMTLTRLLRGDDAANNITAILAEIKKLPVSEQAMSRAAVQSSILRTINDEIFASSPIAFKTTDTAATDAALGKLKSITEEQANGMLKAVDAAFPGDPFMGDTLRLALGGLSANSIASRMRLARAGSDTAVNLGIRDSTSTGLLFAFGYMNPTAAAARRITAGQIEEMERLSKDVQRDIIGTILAAPQEFSTLAAAIAQKESPTILRELRDGFLNAAKLNLRYEIRVGPEGTEDEQTQSLFGGVVNTIGQGVDKVLSVFD